MGVCTYLQLVNGDNPSLNYELCDSFCNWFTEIIKHGELTVEDKIAVSLLPMFSEMLFNMGVKNYLEWNTLKAELSQEISRLLIKVFEDSEKRNEGEYGLQLLVSPELLEWDTTGMHRYIGSFEENGEITFFVQIEGICFLGEYMSAILASEKADIYPEFFTGNPNVVRKKFREFKKLLDRTPIEWEICDDGSILIDHNFHY